MTNELTLKLKPTTDIAATLGRMKKRSQLLAGFALETDNEIKNATAKAETEKSGFHCFKFTKGERCRFRT